MTNRDDFREPVKRAVAARAGWHCSLCRRLTVGPSEEAPNAVTKIGVAAHIAAAAPGPGARRYDATMTPEQRAGIDNAIWLCANDATLIDRDEVTYPADRLRAIKRDHEQSIARAVRAGARADLATGLLAIGPDVVCTGEVTAIAAGGWTLHLAHFLIGDMHKIVSFIEGFAEANPEGQYVLSNELGDGRVLVGAPTLTKGVDGYSLLCPVAPSSPRIDAQQLGSDLALHPETGDIYLDEKGDLARVSGLEYLPQHVQSLLSLNQGESVFAPRFGMSFLEYFESFNGSPWLDLLLKLDVVRQASIPFQDSVIARQYTPLRCVTRVHSVELLAHSPTDNKLPVRMSLDVQGIGEWVREFPVYMPTAAQMAARAKLRANLPWFSDKVARHAR